jgi:hypothetical protein
MITKEIVKQKILEYLTLQLSLDSLIHWAEDSLMNADLVEKDAKILSDILSQIGVSNVQNFGIQWHEWREILLKLGYEMKIDLQLIAV